MRLYHIDKDTLIPTHVSYLLFTFTNSVAVLWVSDTPRDYLHKKLLHWKKIIACCVVLLINQFFWKTLLELLSLEYFLLEWAAYHQPEYLHFFCLSLSPNTTHHLAIIAGIPVRFDHNHLASACKSEPSSPSLPRKQENSPEFHKILYGFVPLVSIKSTI